jgi:hypothetical protein
MPSQIDVYTLSKLISDQVPVGKRDSFSPSEWNDLLSLARREGVAPLIYWRFSKSGEFSAIPESSRNALRVLYASSWAQNQKLLKELEVLAKLFNEVEIPLVVLKGACYALTIYPDIGLRPMGDLDVLVPKEKLAQAVRIARSLGYDDAQPEASPGLDDLLSHHACLQKSGLVLEIHDSLVADKTFAYSVPVDWFWSQTEPLGRNSQRQFENLCTLTPAAQVLYAASHAMLQHGGSKTPLRWYYDLDRLVRVYSDRLDWDLILSQARTFNWGSALNAALSQTQAYFDTPIPEIVILNLSGYTDRLQSLVDLKQSGSLTHVLEERQKLLSLNWVGRFRLFFALIFPTPTYMRWRYKIHSNWLLPLYYLIRWAGILKDAMYTGKLLGAKWMSALRNSSSG